MEATLRPALRILMSGLQRCRLPTRPQQTGRQPSPTRPVPVLQGVPLLTFSMHDQASIDNVVGQAKVVIACTGPYAELGTPVVDACVRLGTHYVDLPGGWVGGGGDHGVLILSNI